MPAHDKPVRGLHQPIDIAWLAAFRVLFGALMLISMLRFIVYGWIDGIFVAPSFHFRYWGLGWLPMPGAFGTHLLFWVLALLAASVMLGLLYRVTAPAFALGFAYLQSLDVTMYLNHYYLATLLACMLALSPAHRAFSLDARWRGLGATHVPAVWLWLLRFQIGVVYTFAGLAKLYGDWLLHAQPLQIWLGSRTELPVIGPLLSHPLAAPFMSWAGFLFDTTIVWWLLWRKTRRTAYALVIAFHVATSALFPIGMFPFIMILSALVFFDPSWPRALASRLLRRPLSGNLPVTLCTPQWPRFALVLGAIYCLFQLTWPMRYLYYGGNVRWHEQGMRFSWRVMVREKNGSVTFRVRDPKTGREGEVSPHRYLTRLQESEMSSQPDLVLQMAHHIRDDFERRGLGSVEVRADVLVSLNGRNSKRMIDPNVDLTQIRDGLGKATWILPAPDEPPPQIRALAR